MLPFFKVYVFAMLLTPPLVVMLQAPAPVKPALPPVITEKVTPPVKPLATADVSRQYLVYPDGRLGLLVEVCFRQQDRGLDAIHTSWRAAQAAAILECARFQSQCKYGATYLPEMRSISGGDELKAPDGSTAVVETGKGTAYVTRAAMGVLQNKAPAGRTGSVPPPEPPAGADTLPVQQGTVAVRLYSGGKIVREWWPRAIERDGSLITFKDQDGRPVWVSGNVVVERAYLPGGKTQDAPRDREPATLFVSGTPKTPPSPKVPPCRCCQCPTTDGPKCGCGENKSCTCCRCREPAPKIPAPLSFVSYPPTKKWLVPAAPPEPETLPAPTAEPPSCDCAATGVCFCDNCCCGGEMAQQVYACHRRHHQSSVEARPRPRVVIFIGRRHRR